MAARGVEVTLKQWLDSYTPADSSICLSSESVREYTEAYFRDQLAKDRAAFDKAFLKLQGVLPTINEKGIIEYRDGRKGTYALNEDIQDAILPLLQAHGFTLHFETYYPDHNAIGIEGVLTHKRGHQRKSRFESGADMTGGKTIAQARGSIVSYGHRYTSVDLLNLVTRGADNDGASAPFNFGFDPKQLSTPEAKATFLKLLNAVLEDSLDECWQTLDTSDRASVGFECVQYVKTLAGYVR